MTVLTAEVIFSVLVGGLIGVGLRGASRMLARRRQWSSGNLVERILTSDDSEEAVIRHLDRNPFYGRSPSHAVAPRKT